MLFFRVRRLRTTWNTRQKHDFLIRRVKFSVLIIILYLPNGFVISSAIAIVGISWFYVHWMVFLILFRSRRFLLCEWAFCMRNLINDSQSDFSIRYLYTKTLPISTDELSLVKAPTLGTTSKTKKKSPKEQCNVQTVGTFARFLKKWRINAPRFQHSNRIHSVAKSPWNKRKDIG